jgi:hypothetical protein
MKIFLRTAHSVSRYRHLQSPAALMQTGWFLLFAKYCLGNLDTLEKTSGNPSFVLPRVPKRKPLETFLSFKIFDPPGVQKLKIRIPQNYIDIQTIKRPCWTKKIAVNFDLQSTQYPKVICFLEDFGGILSMTICSYHG